MMQSRPAKLACVLGAIFGAVVLVAVPREASTAAEPGRRLSAFNGALCYAARYPDVKAAFCDGDRCNARQAMAHFRDHGRREGRLFGCDDGDANGTASLRVADDGPVDVPTYCLAGRRCRGGRGQEKRCWADKTCASKADNRRCPAPASPHSVVVLTRVLFEQPFLAGFVDWYAARGVECVLLVRDRLDHAGDVAALPPVAVQRTAPPGKHPNAVLGALMAEVRATGYAWVLVVDADEYLALHPRFDRSLPRFIEAQAARVPGLAAIQFSWAAAEALGAACPARAPFDAFKANRHVKTLARVDRVANWGHPHMPVLRLRDADCPGLPQKCSVVLNGNRAAAATRTRRVGDSAEYRLSPFTGGTPGGRRPPPGSVPPAAYADAALAHVHVRSVTNVLVKACGAAKPKHGWPDRLPKNVDGLRAAALARGPLDLAKFVRDMGRKGGQMVGERGCGPAAGVQGCTDKRAPVDLAHLDWGPGGWTFCDAARERAIAEDVVAPCLGVAADVGPRLAERVAEAVREATL